MHTEKKVYPAVWLLFILYVAVMLWLLFGRTPVTVSGTYWQQICDHINLIPFRTILAYVRRLGEEAGRYGLSASEINLYGNVLVFVPCGFFLPALFLRLQSFRRYLLCFSLGLVAVEVAQLFTLRGICDIDDLILNVVGAALGYGAFRAAKAIGAAVRAGRRRRL